MRRGVLGGMIGRVVIIIVMRGRSVEGKKKRRRARVELVRVGLMVWLVR
jgi:hypothetical protein